MEPAADDLRRIRDLYDRGLYLQAHAAAAAVGPYREWRTTPARVLAGRLAGNLGAPRLNRVLHFRAWRDDRKDPEALYTYAYALLDRRGPLDAWEVLREAGDFAGAPEAVRSDLLALRAEIASLLRDFDRADSEIARAEEISADRAWTCVARARVLEHEDRYEEALAAVKQGLGLRPWYRPAVQTAAHLLQLLDRDPEALQLLRESMHHLESGAVLVQLASLEIELGYYAEARATLDGADALHPLMEPALRRWLAARRSDAAYACGDLEAAKAFAATLETPFYRGFVERLGRADGDTRRVLLPVRFVRQHHMTCAPATLTAISRYWDMEASHLGVAEEICYDGTPAHSERRWAEENGWTAREFTVTWESAVALLDRGVPFTLTTVEPASAHLQAVIGYDARRSCTIIRDPYQRNVGEFLHPAMTERYRSTGPRGMLLVPRVYASKVADLELPEAALYDQFYALQQALERHDREAAARACESLAAAAPGHRLALGARRTLAAYDADRATQLRCVEELLALFPDDANLQLERLAHLREFGRREERLELLAKLCASEESSPIFQQQYARELAPDARQADAATRLLRRAIRALGRDAESYHTLAGIRWNRGAREEALELYRFAACVEDRNERYAESYFIACRHLRQTATALLFLRGRFHRFGGKSAWPARTLFWAYEQLDRGKEAFEVLEEALRKRPDDGELLLFAADVHSRYGAPPKAAAALKAAEGRCHRVAWLRASAQLAGAEGRLKDALGLWREIVAAEPFSIDAQASTARLLAETEGQAAALAHLDREIERFPHHAALHRLWIEWLREGDRELYERAIRKLIEINPADAWARRELALCLASAARPEESLEQADFALRLEPSSGSHYVRARVLGASGRVAEAMEACRASIRLSVDAEAAIHELVGLCDAAAARRQELDFVRSELIRQVIFGDGLLTYRQAAADTVEPDDLRLQLQEALDARPDLWHAWSAVVRQLSDMDRLEEAKERALQAVERFPLVPRLWVDLAHVCQLKGDPAGERAALDQALKINPSWGTASRELAAAHERAGDYASARTVIEAAIHRSPLDAFNHGGLAQMLWKTGEKDAALAQVERAVVLEPGYDWAWGRLNEWSRELERTDVPIRLAKDLTTRRAGESRSWMVFARTLRGGEWLDERLSALDTALRLNPRFDEARDLKASLLADAGRFDEAIATCGGDSAPLILRGRAAWIESRRGDRTAAIARMKAVVAEDPGYYWGWSQLADWYLDEKDDAGYLDASNHLARLAPQSEVAMGYRGDARLRTGDRDGAKADFKRAIELEPDYSFGVLKLFDLYFEDDQLDPAEAVLEVATKHVGGPYVEARVVQLEVKRKRVPKAIEALKRLCEMPEDFEWPLDAALEALEGKRGTDVVRKTLYEACFRPTVNPWVGRAWVRHCASTGSWEELRGGLNQLWRVDAARLSAAPEYARLLADTKQTAVFRQWVKERQVSLRKDPRSFAAVASAFRLLGRYPDGIEWLSQGGNAAALTLLTRALCERALGRVEAARETSREALKLKPDASTIMHRIWLAFDDAIEGKKVEMLAAPGTYYEGINDLILALESADFGKLGARDWKGDRALQLSYRRTLVALAKRQGLAGWIRLLFRWR